jgi:thiamine pyrophosphokinase
VTVDGGADIALKLRIRPLLHVGDGDSFAAPLLDRLKPQATIILNKKKSISDLEFALRELPEESSKLVAGAHSDNDDRPDHALINLVLLSKMQRTIFVDEKNWAAAIFPQRELRFSTPQKTLFSVVDLKGPSEISIRGAEWSGNKKLFKYVSQGLSNRTQAHTVKVRASRGGLLIVHSDLLRCRHSVL